MTNHADSGIRFYLAGLGLLQGVAIYLVRESGLIDPAMRLLEDTAFLFLLITPTVCMLVLDGKTWKSAMAFSGGMGLLLGGLYYLSVSWIGLDSLISNATYRGSHGGSTFQFAYYLSCLAVAAISLPFFQRQQEKGPARFSYAPLFLHAWTNVLTLLIAGFFLGLGWLLLALLAALFGMIGISFFGDLIDEAWFGLPFSTAFFALGLAMAREKSGIIQVMLKLVTILSGFLTPLLAGMILLFLSALPFTGVMGLWDTQFASRILLSALFLLILFENAAIQTGQEENRFWRPAGWLVMLANILLPVLGILAVLALSERVGQHGWTPARFYMMALAICGFVYGLAYAGAVLWKKQDWMTAVCRFNPLLAAGTALVALVVHLPVIEPYGLSARDQLARLKNGEVIPEEFDFEHLLTDLGTEGQTAFQSIKDDPELMANERIQRKLALAEETKNHFGGMRMDHPADMDGKGRKDLLFVSDYIDIYPKDAVVAEEDARAWLDYHGWRFEDCYVRQGTTETRCAILLEDMNEDGAEDMVLFNSGTGAEASVYLRTRSGKWEFGSDMELFNQETDSQIETGAGSWPELKRYVEEGRYSLEPSGIRDLVIGGRRFVRSDMIHHMRWLDD
ncbi:DUF4153 domain-containing protein [Aestuariispira insulae]|uniref:Uncharacterized protein DUF4153 n=1 Tax=Aestuariispira insulae TaxID=1461337 RepID=A0A3D9HX82_9PROT|nr:DUF4153 domain-containing protein [Aestuariispira insulae]RED54025.1 uncharacterized protein DUF4153 [Aestuariispira insulae]